MPKDDKPIYAKNYLVNKWKLSPVAASGIIGNLQGESGLNTKAVGDNGTSYGIAQWHNERRDALNNFARKQNKDASHLDTQLDYLVYELNTSEKNAFKKINQAKTPEQAAIAFMNHFERPAELAKKESVGKRVSYAKSIFGDTSETPENINYKEDNSQYVIEDNSFFKNYNSPQEAQFSSSLPQVDEEDQEPPKQFKSDLAKDRLIQEEKQELVLQQLSTLLQSPQQEIEQQPVQQQDQGLDPSLYQVYNIQHPDYVTPQFQQGGNFSDIYEKTTGKKWNTAKTEGLTDGSYEANTKLKNRLLSQQDQLTNNIDNASSLQGATNMFGNNKTFSYNKTEDVYASTEPLQEVAIKGKVIIPTTVKNQLEYIGKNKKEDKNFAIINKKINTIYYFDKNNSLLGLEPVVTGQNNKDLDYSISMRDWFKMDGNEGKTHEDYFKYLEKYESKVTPSGHFTIASLNDNITDNPASWRGKIFNVFKDIVSLDEVGTREKDIQQNRKRDYGSQNKLFTLRDDNGVYSSKAIHGTDNKNREVVLDNTSSPKQRDLSNGCINVGDNSKCFSLLNKNSSVYIMPEFEKEGDIVEKNKKFISNGGIIKKSKSKIYNALKKAGIKATEEDINFITSVHGKESSFGTNKLIPVQDKVPFFNSDGEFQINEDTFKDNLPTNYSNTFENGVIAVKNFLEKNKGLTEEQLYRLYNSGSINGGDKKVIKTFSKIYNKVKQIN